jgi:hypothetical protein
MATQQIGKQIMNWAAKMYQKSLAGELNKMGKYYICRSSILRFTGGSAKYSMAIYFLKCCCCASGGIPFCLWKYSERNVPPYPLLRSFCCLEINLSLTHTHCLSQH